MVAMLWNGGDPAGGATVVVGHISSLAALFRIGLGFQCRGPFFFFFPELFARVRVRFLRSFPLSVHCCFTRLGLGLGFLRSFSPFCSLIRTRICSFLVARR